MDDPPSIEDERRPAEQFRVEICVLDVVGLHDRSVARITQVIRLESKLSEFFVAEERIVHERDRVDLPQGVDHAECTGERSLLHPAAICDSEYRDASSLGRTEVFDQTPDGLFGHAVVDGPRGRGERR